MSILLDDLPVLFSTCLTEDIFVKQCCISTIRCASLISAALSFIKSPSLSSVLFFSWFVITHPIFSDLTALIHFVFWLPFSLLKSHTLDICVLSLSLLHFLLVFDAQLVPDCVWFLVFFSRNVSIQLIIPLLAKEYSQNIPFHHLYNLNEKLQKWWLFDKSVRVGNSNG